ncbi:MAG TPA: hypothetical protein DCE48_04935 [Lachnospiraceae bacterium]|nr:hypothetical protein [Lachnospiraceae bacterium]
MTLNTWNITLDSNDSRYTLTISDDNIVSVIFCSNVIATIHFQNDCPIFVTSEAIIKVDVANKRIIVCSPNDGTNRFAD